MALSIRTNDQVIVITGRDKGKIGRVMKVLPDENRVLVEKVNVVKRHTKPNAKNRQGGIVEKEASIHASNVMLLDKNGKRTRKRPAEEKAEKKERGAAKAKGSKKK